MAYTMCLQLFQVTATPLCLAELHAAILLLNYSMKVLSAEFSTIQHFVQRTSQNY